MRVYFLWGIFISLVALMGFHEDPFEGLFLNVEPLELQFQSIELPHQTDWVDHGEILSRGEAGNWDYLLWGGFTGTVIKKDSLFFLYYQGAREYDEQFETVTYRSIGVATSSDGLSFTKYRHNPIVTWFPYQGLEEGAASGGATLGENDEVVLYYGANTMVNAHLVNADGRLAVSNDGFEFSDAGVVLDHRDRKVWGAGDEIFPIVSFRDLNTWYVYYIPNGTTQRGALGVAWGPQRNRLTRSRAALSDGKKVQVWGMGGYARIGESMYALFLNNVRKPHLQVRIVHLDAPTQLSAPVHSYTFDNFTQATVYLDRETQSWYMFYRTEESEGYGVKVAPVVNKAGEF